VYSFGGPSVTAVGLAVAVDISNNVLVTGSFSGGTLTVGTTTLTNAGQSDIFVTKLAGSNGDPLWSRR
jgi:hypothetical protein